MSEEEESNKGFRVRDRRRFNSEGEARSDGEEESFRATEVIQPRAEGPGEGQASAAPDADGGQVDFISFVASLATNALAAMGALPDAHARGLPPPNLDLAREYLDILGMLQHKTRGNLNAQESAAMQQMLTELRLRFVEAQQGK